MDTLPDFLVDKLPEPRRSLHRRAVEVAARYERDGTPFALVLRTYGVTVLFAEAEDEPGYLLENRLADDLEPAGIEIVQVQVEDPVHAGIVLYDERLPPFMGVRTPSLFIGSDNWLEPVRYLIERAELIVVLLTVATPGVLLELETIAAHGRADRTIVLVSGETAGGRVDRTVMLLDGDTVPDTTGLLEMSILARFTRVLWTGDFDSSSPLDTFVFRDLVERLRAIRLTPARRRRKLIEAGALDRELPVTWVGVRAAFEELALISRAANRSDFAARYFGSAARLALMDGDIESAVDGVAAQAGILSLLVHAQRAVQVLAELDEEIYGLVREHWHDDPAIVLAHAKLTAERARMLTRNSELDEAIRILDDEYVRCESPLNRRALSILLTTRGWTLRKGTDVDAVLQAGKQAFELARAENAPWEMARALTVIGATLYDLGELIDAANVLWNAAEMIPADQYHEDAWLIRSRLAHVLVSLGRVEDARTALELAVAAAEAGSLGAWAERSREELAELKT